MLASRSDEIHLEWRDLNYQVISKRFNWFNLKSTETTVHVLKDASGSVTAGQLVAIIGPSGSGKTTLLAAISQRLRGNLSGTISLNGSPVGRMEMADRSSFIPQFDVSSEYLTVYEHMKFMYKLKNCFTFGPEEAYINSILRSLGLLRVSSSRIEVLSGGEKKKLLLATELLIDPNIIFCDEPTTGLDSYNALSLLSSMQMLVKKTEVDEVHKANDEDDMDLNLRIVENSHKNKLVICSIHQPSSEVFACFSHVILLQEGRIAFQGSVNEAEKFFTSFGFNCPPSFNRADFFVNKLSEQIYDINHNFTNHQGDFTLGSLNESVGTCCKNDRIADYEPSKRHVSWIYQLLILSHMLGLESVRNIKEFAFKLATFIITGLFAALLFSEINDNDQTAIQDINGFVQIITNEIILSTGYNILFYYPSKLPLLRRETGEGKYSLSAFYVSYLISSMPKSIIECFVFLSIIYPFAKFLRGFWMFIKIGCTLSMISIPGTAYGLMLSGIFESSMVATSLAPPFDIIFLLLGGIYVKLKLLWFLKYLSMFYYGTEALSIIIWSEANVLSCEPPVYTACFRTGSEILDSLFYETEYLFLWIDYAGLLGTALLMNIIGFLGIRRIVKQSGFY